MIEWPILILVAIDWAAGQSQAKGILKEGDVHKAFATRLNGSTTKVLYIYKSHFAEKWFQNGL